MTSGMKDRTGHARSVGSSADHASGGATSVGGRGYRPERLPSLKRPGPVFGEEDGGAVAGPEGSGRRGAAAGEAGGEGSIGGPASGDELDAEAVIRELASSSPGSVEA
jgi:hypothetical protein